jgi:Flp pilus assembly protein TadB
MLNEAERRKLADIEAELRTADPRLAHHLSAGTARGLIGRWVAVAAVGYLILLVAAVWAGLLVAGPPAGIAAGLTVCAVFCGWLLQRRGQARQTILPPE